MLELKCVMLGLETPKLKCVMLGLETPKLKRAPGLCLEWNALCLEWNALCLGWNALCLDWKPIENRAFALVAQWIRAGHS